MLCFHQSCKRQQWQHRHSSSWPSIVLNDLTAINCNGDATWTIRIRSGLQNGLASTMMACNPMVATTTTSSIWSTRSGKKPSRRSIADGWSRQTSKLAASRRPNSSWESNDIKQWYYTGCFIWYKSIEFLYEMFVQGVYHDCQAEQKTFVCVCHCIWIFGRRSRVYQCKDSCLHSVPFIGPLRCWL